MVERAAGPVGHLRALGNAEPQEHADQAAQAGLFNAQAAADLTDLDKARRLIFVNGLQALDVVTQGNADLVHIGILQQREQRLEPANALHLKEVRLVIGGELDNRRVVVLPLAEGRARLGVKAQDFDLEQFLYGEARRRWGGYQVNRALKASQRQAVDFLLGDVERNRQRLQSGGRSGTMFIG